MHVHMHAAKQACISKMNRYMTAAVKLQESAWIAAGKVATGAKLWAKQKQLRKNREEKGHSHSPEQHDEGDSEAVGSKSDFMMQQISILMKDDEASSLWNLLYAVEVNRRYTALVECHVDNVLSKGHNRTKTKQLLKASGVPLINLKYHQKCQGWEDYLAVLAEALLDETKTTVEPDSDTDDEGEAADA